MPTYEYRCTKGHRFETQQSMSDAPLEKCEVCGAPVQRVLHPPAVQFKGSGFYNTDYGTRNRQREKASSESSSGDGARASGSDSGDAKPAAEKATTADKPKTEKAASKST